MSTLQQYEANSWGNLEQDDFSVPIVTLAQRTSRKGTPGKFVYNSGLEIDKIEQCVLLKPNKSRVLYGPVMNGPSACGSQDWHKPSIRYENPVANSCHHCILSRWDNDMSVSELQEKRAWEKKLNKNKESKAPVCTEVYQLLMLDRNDQPFMITFSKTQLEIVEKKLFSRLRNSYGVPWGARFDMIPIQQDDGQFIWYNVDFVNFTKVEEDMKVQLASQSVRFNSAHDKVDQEYAKQDEEKRKSVDFDNDFDAGHINIDDPPPFDSQEPF